MDIKQCIYESTLYIHSMFAESISIADIAARAYLSPSYFSVMFRTFTDYTVKNYLNRYRLYRAALDLQYKTVINGLLRLRIQTAFHPNRHLQGVSL